MVKRKICVVTGTRAEYGLLYWLMKEIKNDDELELQIIVTGMHLSPEFGLTYQVIEKDSFYINEKVEMLLSSDTPVGIAKSIGLATIGFADSLDRLKPDLLVLLGDRFEILAAAQAALVSRIPIAHIAGGDITEGVFDEAIRHSITKMSHIHFVTNKDSQARVIQLGENPDHVFNVGSPGIDYIKKTKLLTQNEIQEKLGFELKNQNILVTFHPSTLDATPSTMQFVELLKALEKLNDVGIIFTKSNADTEGRAINEMIDDFVKKDRNAKAFVSLGQLLYLSTVAQVDVVVGNSSSGLYEVPSLKKPTVNIGSRQKGRIQADSVIQCEPIESEIYAAINHSFSLDCSRVINPYGDGNASKRMFEIIKSIEDYSQLLKKTFVKIG